MTRGEDHGMSLLPVQKTAPVIFFSSLLSSPKMPAEDGKFCSSEVPDTMSREVGGAQEAFPIRGSFWYGGP